MSQKTANGNDMDRVIEYYPPASNAPETRVDTVLRRAERLVRDLAPPPEPVDNEYKPTAADAELAVFEYLYESMPHVERKQELDATVVYRDPAGVEDVVRREMSRYYVGPRVIPPNTPETRRGSSLHNVSPEPLW